MQTFIIQRTLDKRVPYTTEFREYHAEQKQLYLDRKKNKRTRKLKSAESDRTLFGMRFAQVETSPP